MDELILRRAQKGDASAFEQLVTPYEQMIWRVCWHYLHHREDAMDCAQEVMLKAWRSIGQYRQDCGFSSWLYRIAGSVCIDFLRKQKRMVDSDSMDAMAENGFEPVDDSPTPKPRCSTANPPAIFPAPLTSFPPTCAPSSSSTRWKSSATRILRRLRAYPSAR